MACCPPGSAPFLASTYSPEGRKTTLSEVEFYEVNFEVKDKVVIIVPDIWGWDSGRTRSIADMISRCGFRVVVPKLLLPAFEGGTDGDGLPPDFDMSVRGSEGFPYLLSFSWDMLKPKISALLSHLKSEGALTFGSVGFCWGAWVLANTAADFPNDISGIASPHPSIQLEDVRGGKAAQLVAKVKCPVLLLPAGNDGATYRPGGEIYEALKLNQPNREIIIEYPDMVHGWVPRGDITNEKVLRDVDKALTDICNFLIEILN